MKRLVMLCLTVMLAITITAIPALAHEDVLDEPDNSSEQFVTTDPELPPGSIPYDELAPMLIDLISVHDLWDELGIELLTIPTSGRQHDDFHAFQEFGSEFVMGHCHQGYWEYVRSYCAEYSGNPPSCTRWVHVYRWHPTHTYGCNAMSQ